MPLASSGGISRGGVTDMFYLPIWSSASRKVPQRIDTSSDWCHSVCFRLCLSSRCQKQPNACPRRELLFSTKLKEGAVMKKLPSSCVESPRERALAGDPRDGLN